MLDMRSKVEMDSTLKEIAIPIKAYLWWATTGSYEEDQTVFNKLKLTYMYIDKEMTINYMLQGTFLFLILK